MSTSTLQRYVQISGNGLPYCICLPGELDVYLREFLGDPAEPIGEPIRIEDAWMSADEFAALADWQG